MGIDVQPICKHNLDTSTIAALAADLSQRLKINITYGFFNMEDLAELTGHSGFDFVTLGKVIYDKKASMYKLHNSFEGIEQFLYEKMGRDFAAHPVYIKACGDQVRDDNWFSDIKKVSYDLEEDNIDHKNILFIYDHIALLNEHYIFRWWSFCQYICDGFYRDEGYKKKDDSLSEFRLKHLELSKKLGGNEIYYAPDGVDEMFMDAAERGLPWPEILKEVKERIGDYYFDIPDIFTNKHLAKILADRYRHHEMMRYSILENNPTALKLVPSQSIYPKMFIDDGRDLKK